MKPKTLFPSGAVATAEQYLAALIESDVTHAALPGITEGEQRPPGKNQDRRPPDKVQNRKGQTIVRNTDIISLDRDNVGEVHMKQDGILMKTDDTSLAVD